jgi:hypothetical protein
VRPGGGKLGEKKRKWYALANAPCACDSGKPGGECCWTPTRWFKAPASIDLRATGHTGSLNKCYLRELGTCSDKVSGEHIISANVLRIVGGDENKIRLTGVPWLPKGETRDIGISSLVSNCLCEAHNHALSQLDAVAGRFYRAIQTSMVDKAAPVRTRLFSGHDIERWLLKTTAGLAASKYLGADGEVLPPLFAGAIDIAELLQDPSAWRSPMGLYVLGVPGQRFRPTNALDVAPLTSATSREIAGLITNIHSLSVALLLDRKEAIKDTPVQKAPYRIEQFNVNTENGRQIVQMSWIKRHA